MGQRLLVAILLSLGLAACGGGGAGQPVGTGGTTGGAGTGDPGTGGVAGTQTSGGTGGAAAADCPAAGGAAGTDSAGGTSGGVLVECPSSPPSGCCSVENLSCAYPTESCVCDGRSWKCYACPATRPTTSSQGTETLTDPRLWMTCQYGDVTCSYPSNLSSGSNVSIYGRNEWTCGVCPASRPSNGAACGNTTFECRYGTDTCHCGGGEGWKCATPSCDTKAGAFNSGYLACVAPGHFTCQYPALDQICTCGTQSDDRRCTCPASRPANGSLCLSYAGHDGTLRDCMYGDAKCSCGGTWQCTDPICPTAMPAPGSSCSMQLSCAYGAMFCACDGATWSCS